MRHHRFIRLAFAVAALAAFAGSAAAQKPAAPAADRSGAAASQPAADPWFGRMAKPKDMDSPRQFGTIFSIELPKGWQWAPGHAATMFLVAEKTKGANPGGAIALEYMRLQGAFDPSLLSRFAKVELEDVQQREIAGKSFTMENKLVDGRPLIVIQYDRPGLSGAPDHVVQYSFPVGDTMYHLVCIAPLSEINKYQAIFAHTAASFTPGSAKAAGK